MSSGRREKGLRKEWQMPGGIWACRVYGLITSMTIIGKAEAKLLSVGRQRNSTEYNAHRRWLEQRATPERSTRCPSTILLAVLCMLAQALSSSASKMTRGRKGWEQLAGQAETVPRIGRMGGIFTGNDSTETTKTISHLAINVILVTKTKNHPLA